MEITLVSRVAGGCYKGESKGFFNGGDEGSGIWKLRSKEKAGGEQGVYSSYIWKGSLFLLCCLIGAERVDRL